MSLWYVIPGYMSEVDACQKTTSRNIYICFLSHLTILIMLLNSVFFSQALDSAGVPGIDRVDSLAEYLVELRNQPSRPLTNQQVRNIQFSLLSTSLTCHMLTLAHVLFSHLPCIICSLCLGEQYSCSLAEPAGLR